MITELDGQPYRPEDSRVTGSIEVQRHGVFDLDDLFEIAVRSQSQSSIWITRINRVAAVRIREAITAWLGEPPPEGGE
jgi:hypothetical protein